MPCFLSPISPPLYVLSSTQSSRQWSLLPCPHAGQDLQSQTQETQNPGGTQSALAPLAASSSGDNPTGRSIRPPQIPIFGRKGAGISGGSPRREGRGALACGGSGSFGEKIVSLHNRAPGNNLQSPHNHFVGGGGEDVSSARKAGAWPTEAVSSLQFVKGVEMSPFVPVAESPGFANGMAGAQVVGKNNSGITGNGIPSKESCQIVYLGEEMGQLTGSPLPKWSCDGRSEIPTIGYLIDRVRCLGCGLLFRDVLRCRGDEILTISDFNELLRTLVGHDELESAVSLFSELSSYSLSPNCWSFSIMIQCLCKKNDPDKAKDVLYHMMQNGFRPTTMLFTVLINCFCKKGRLQSAYELFKRMGRMGCHPTIQTYNCLLYGLCFVGRVEEAFQLLKKLEKSTTEPDIYTFTIVIDGFCKVGRTDEAIELLNDALELGIKPNVVTFNSLINGFCKEGRSLEGFGLLRDMKGGDCQPDHISYRTLLQGLLKCGEGTTALNLYKDMMEDGLKVEERVMNTLLRGLCRKCTTNPELLKEAEELFETIMSMGYGLSPYTYCLVVQAFANGGHTNKALAHLNEMGRVGLAPRTMTYNMVIRVLCSEGRVDDALLVLILMIKENKIPSTFSCNRLLIEFNRQERFLDACTVYAAALKYGVHLHQQPKKQSKEC